MKTEFTLRKFNPTLRVTSQLFKTVACLGTVILICASAPAQNLFVADLSGNIYKFTLDGVQSTFASGLSGPIGLTFDSAGNLFVPDDSYTVTNDPAGGGAIFRTIGAGVIYKFTPDGVRSTLASALLGQTLLALDSRQSGLPTRIPPGEILTSHRPFQGDSRHGKALVAEWKILAVSSINRSEKGNHENRTRS